MKKSLLLVLFCLFLFGTGFAQWQKAKLPANNAILSLAVDYSTSYVYAGTEGNGVYLSADTGATWHTANTGLPANLSVWKILFQNKNIFLATNDGVYTSVNNGISWQQSGLNGVLVNCLANCNYNDTPFLYAGTEKGIYQSKNNGIDWALYAFPNQGVRTMITNGVSFYAGMMAGGLNYYEDYRKIWAAADTGITTKTMVKCISVGNHQFLGSGSDDPIIGTDHGVYVEKSTGNWSRPNDGLDSNTIVNSIFCQLNQFMRILIGTGNDPGNVYVGYTYDEPLSALSTGIDGNVNTLDMYRNIVFAGGSSLWVLKSDIPYIHLFYQNKLMQATGDSVTIKILTSEHWWFTNKTDWITISPDEGIGDGTMTITAAPNNTNFVRVGFVKEFGGGQVELSIYQDAANTTGIENASSANVTIYPVPVKDDLVISFPNQIGNIRFVLYNLSGVQLLASTLTANTTKVNMSGFKAGVYVLKIYSGNTCINRKIVKQ
jgi:ligand-binding sensor domain-containing protein